MKLDENIGNLFINSGLFKNIHPNIISIIGIYLNILILWCVLNNISIHVVSVLIMLRCLADILDGMIARKYNKKSEIGGWLDTIQDMLLGFFIVPFILLYKYTKDKTLSVIVPSILTITSLFVYYYNDISDHDDIDSEAVQIFRNNSVLLFILGIILNYKFNIFSMNEKYK